MAPPSSWRCCATGHRAPMHSKYDPHSRPAVGSRQDQVAAGWFLRPKRPNVPVCLLEEAWARGWKSSTTLSEPGPAAWRGWTGRCPALAVARKWKGAAGSGLSPYRNFRPPQNTTAEPLSTKPCLPYPVRLLRRTGTARLRIYHWRRQQVRCPPAHNGGGDAADMPIRVRVRRFPNSRWACGQPWLCDVG